GVAATMAACKATACASRSAATPATTGVSTPTKSMSGLPLTQAISVSPYEHDIGEVDDIGEVYGGAGGCSTAKQKIPLDQKALLILDSAASHPPVCSPV